ncbi:MAG: HD domain-containing protein [Verrucomicrobiota bacterium]
MRNRQPVQPNTPSARKPKTAFFRDLFVEEWFPSSDKSLPFAALMADLFFNPIADNSDFPIHGPNVIRLSTVLLDSDLVKLLELFVGSDAEKNKGANLLRDHRPKILESLGIDSKDEESRRKNLEFMRIAALYHDIGKTIRRANHPQIGANILRHFDRHESDNFLTCLRTSKDWNEAGKRNRFNLICSIVQHHDKFGVVSTGEGSLPIFSDILFFTSTGETESLRGIIKNVTSVMVLNLADIAAVNNAIPSVRFKAYMLAKQINEFSKNHLKPAKQLSTDAVPKDILGDLKKEDIDRIAHEVRAIASKEDSFKELKKICADPKSTMGLQARKAEDVLCDWNVLLQAIMKVNGNRTELKVELIKAEQNPARAIKRIQRLLLEAAITTNCDRLVPFLSEASVEADLVGALGAQQFQAFCEKFATIVKLDYGLSFFKAICCGCVRASIHNHNAKMVTDVPWGKLTQKEAQRLSKLEESDAREIAGHFSSLSIKILDSLVSRYTGVLNLPNHNPRRFGFQLRDLTGNANIRSRIIGLLCFEKNKEFVGLTWITDEVSIWSMD